MEKQFSYYQFQKDLNYPIYLRFENFEFENLFVEVIEILGFQKIERDEVKNHNLSSSETRVLKIVSASSAVKQKMELAQGGFSLSHDEVFHSLGLYDVYIFKKVAMMVLGERNPLWELGVTDTSDQVALKIVLNRFLSQSMAMLNVAAFWGCAIEKGFISQSLKECQGNALFIDPKNKKMISSGKVIDIDNDFSILRLIPTRAEQGTTMTKENFYSFLSVKTIYPDPVYKPEKLNLAIYDIANSYQGVFYPEHLVYGEPKKEKAI